MSRPASRPVRPPLQPVDSRHHGPVHGARRLVQSHAMKGEQGPEAAGQTTRCPSRWQIPLARQQSRLVPVDPTLSQRIPPVPVNPTLSRWIPPCPTASHFVPVNPTLSQRIPTCLGESHLSHFIPANPALSRRIPLFSPPSLPGHPRPGAGGGPRLPGRCPSVGVEMARLRRSRRCARSYAKGGNAVDRLRTRD